jgi:hypothetical protein
MLRAAGLAGTRHCAQIRVNRGQSDNPVHADVKSDMPNACMLHEHGSTAKFTPSCSDCQVVRLAAMDMIDKYRLKLTLLLMRGAVACI